MKKTIMPKILIAYQGISGAYSEIASETFARKSLLPKSEIEFVGCEDFDKIFEGVQSEDFEYGVIPVENSLAGSIHRNYDLLGRYNLKVVGEVYVHVNHQLLGIKSAKISDIKEIYSHFQALAQCEHNIKKYLPKAVAKEYFDTAGSAQYVKNEKNITKACLSSIKAGKTYGLQVLRKDFQDDKDNYTRFLIINKEYKSFSKYKPKKLDKFKTTLIFTINENVAGSLFKCLGCFSLRDINLTKIESGPIPKSPWKIQFYFDFEGIYNSQNVINAINNLKEYASEVKILGSYLADKI